ncbi:phosphotransferase [Mycolicibacterium pulveris]|uniref:Aminoglycoside phosphotransferase n=1 Tax=Mycolicibacterium pulveris TaxID=36813 RepID=A0A7I7UQX6_MYCPV|nr:phosphotransferase [Mycolicibacterium pulveris]MCV6983560.1 phosphotransferase [Mycolicibacterium pulveris]BBY83440.1 aminoglycoside phosphotransferase [Mycolicibacterium pulveris]
MSEDTLRLPLEVTDINAEWLTAALRFRYPDVDVLSVDVVDLMPGSATKVRLAVTYDSHVQGLPSSMIVKAGFNPLRSLLADLYRNEVTFYRDLAPTAGIPLPSCYFAGSNPDTGQALLLLEDLTATANQFGRIEATLTPGVAGEALALLAAVHAAYWANTEERAMAALVEQPRQPVAEMLTGTENWERCLELGRFEGLPKVVHNREQVRDAIIGTLRPTDGPRCLIHGDVHLGNMYFTPDGSPRFLDWQAASASTWAADVAYFIVCSLQPETRRETERDLLSGYLEALAQRGVEAPAFDSAWTEYRRHAVWGLLGLLCTPEMQSEEFSRTMGGRFAIAIDDLDSLSVSV